MFGALWLGAVVATILQVAVNDGNSGFWLVTSTVREPDGVARQQASSRFEPAAVRAVRTASPASSGTEQRAPADRDAGTVPGPAADIAALLPAARAARDGLHRDGHHLTRDALAARLRASGHPVRNSRLTPLLQALRCESASQPATTL